jgi:hypothetical protein
MKTTRAGPAIVDRSLRIVGQYSMNANEEGLAGHVASKIALSMQRNRIGTVIL